MYLHVYHTNTRSAHWGPASGWIVAFDYPKFGLLRELQDWCRATYGDESNNRWRDQIRWGEVWFRDESDVVLFQLRWA
jgi:hypothetical protein